MKYCQIQYLKARVAVGILITLLSIGTAMAVPLLEKPSLSDVLGRLDIELQTYLCYCDVTHPIGVLDTAGCATPGARGVVGNIITTAMILSWIPNKAEIQAEHLSSLLLAISRDPINLAVFNDITWEKYKDSTDFTGTIGVGGEFGACPLKFTKGLAHIPDGRVGETARVALYLRQQYSIPIPAEKVKHLEDIHYMVLTSQREDLRNQLAKKWNGSWNPYVNPNTETENFYSQDVVNGVINNIFETRIKN
jgi:hypothetical protein